MSRLAVNCALLQIPVDPLRLVRASNDEIVWLEAIVEDVNRRHEHDRQRVERAR